MEILAGSGRTLLVLKEARGGHEKGGAGQPAELRGPWELELGILVGQTSWLLLVKGVLQNSHSIICLKHT